MIVHFGSQSEGGSAVLKEAQRLISDGLECKLLSIFQDLLSSNYPEQMDFDLYTLWAEETLIEDNLILDILFLVYYESFCTCDAKSWRTLCGLYEGIVTGSYNFQKLAISPDAIRAIYHAKVQLLFILIEALNLENLLQMVHDNIPFRQGSIGFSESDVQQMDRMISSFNTFEAKEEGPLILAWAEIEHVGYVRQAFEASSLGYFLEILQSDTLKYSDGPLAGYRSVLRTFISAFIASYEISLQFEDDNLKLILEILCKIYRGEESLCIQFWDRDSFIDGPVRCLLCNLEGEFPFRTIELVSLLSALCEGAWPSECVFNFLDKSVGLSTPIGISGHSIVDVVSKIVETRSRCMFLVLKACSLFMAAAQWIHGYATLRLLNQNIYLECGILLVLGSGSVSLAKFDTHTVFLEHSNDIQFAYTESGVLVLLLRLAQAVYMKNSEELIVILGLLSRLVTFNAAVCYSLANAWNSFHDEELSMGKQEKYVRIDVVEIVCALVKSFSPSVNACHRVATMAMKGNIFDVALRTNPFDIDSNSLSSELISSCLFILIFDLSAGFVGVGVRGVLLIQSLDFSLCGDSVSYVYSMASFYLHYFSMNCSSGSWLLSGRLAKMFLIDLLDFTMNLLETGLETDTVLALIVFSLQYVLVNHEFWKYRVKRARWKVTLKVLEVMKKCISSISFCQKLGKSFFFLLPLFPSALNQQKLYVSRLFDIPDIEGLQLAISSGLDVFVSMMSAFSKDSPSLPVFHQAILSPMTKPIPVISAAISLISYFRNANIQIGAARLLSVIFTADFSQFNASLSLDDKEVADFRKSIFSILSEQPPWNEDLIVSTLNLLASAARNQPAFLTAVITSKEYLKAQGYNANSEHRPNKTENGSLDSKEESLLHAILQYLRKSEDLFHRKPNILLCLLNFLRALWQGAPQFTKTLEQLKVSDKFWRHLTNIVVLFSDDQDNLSEKLTDKKLQNVAYRYQFLSNVLDILGYEVLLQKKLMHAELVVNRISKSPTNGTEKKVDSKDEGASSLKEIISTWCKSSLLSDLIKACVSWEYDNSSHIRAKVAASLFAVHAMVKIRSGDSGSFSVSLIERVVTLSQKDAPVLALQCLYSNIFALSFRFAISFDLGDFGVLVCSCASYQPFRNCQLSMQSEVTGQELENLILSDLFYHIQGELEGRQIDNRPFKELLQFLLDSKFLDAYKYKQDDDLLPNIKSVYLYNTGRLRADMGLEMWDLLAWKESKEVAETMLLCLQDSNSRMLHSNSKLSALRGLITLLYMHEDNLTEDEASTGLKISEPLVVSCIDHICSSLRATIDLLTPIPDASEDVLDILIAQAELLLLLVRALSNNYSQPTCVLILKTSGCGLKVLSSCRQALAVETAMNFFLKLIIGSVELTFKDLHSDIVTPIEAVESSAEASNSCLGLLPVLCNCIEHPNHCTLSLAAIDLILQGFSTPSTWFPIIQKHLPLQHIVQKLQERTLSKTVSVILKFLLNLARVRQGAEMLLNAGILASLRMLLSDFSEGERIFSSVADKMEKCQPFWGLSLAVITAIIQSLGDSSSAANIVDYVMAYILVEKAPLISYYLSAPEFPTDGHENKRARALKSNISLSELKETQNTLALICVLARYWNSWRKILQSMESQLREKSIHLLAFISRATQCPGESLRRDAPLLCHPVLKEEFEWYKKKSFINCRNGWFALSALGCKSNLNLGSSTFEPLPCAARKAEEVGFVDIAHFPELPMPDILHGLQDQGIAIITELCEANKTKQLAPEIQEVCHVETFSKELRLLIRATEGHVFLKEPLKALKQIVSFVYPELVQQEDLF
ncbi:hypothetical protein DH2020_029623 [Rehmannia glutinosa]|uniref:Uncharacterized protein n=1 Tax=Rehmannia glutinosa TaxID=99300 RepID=A0ABR0VN45_REHGL